MSKGPLRVLLQNRANLPQKLRRDIFLFL